MPLKYKVHFQGERIQILQSGLLLLPSLIFFLSANIHVSGPYLRKQLTPAFASDMVGPSELRAPGSSFGTSLGPVINFPYSFSWITSLQYPSPAEARIWLLLLLISLIAASSISNNLFSLEADPWTKTSQQRSGFQGRRPQVLFPPANRPSLCTHLQFAGLERSLLVLSTVSKQESNAVSVRPSAGYDSKHESLSAQDLTAIPF